MKCRGDSYSVILKPSPAKSSPNAFSRGIAGVWHTWQLIWYLRANAGMADACSAGIRSKKAAPRRQLLTSAFFSYNYFLDFILREVFQFL
jgi:hypothetical protein